MKLVELLILATFLTTVAYSHHSVSTSTFNESTPPSTTSGASALTSSSIAEGNHMPRTPFGLGVISSEELSVVKTVCTSTVGICTHQTSDALLRRAYIKQLWIDVLRQTSLYRTNAKLTEMKAESYMRKAFTAKYILMRLFGFPAKLMPANDGLFEGDILLAEIALDEIIHAGFFYWMELRAEVDLESVLVANDRDVSLLDAKNDERSAIRVDQLRAVSWSSNVFYSIDESIDKANASIVTEAIGEISNVTGSCLTFISRPIVAEHNLDDTLVIKAMPSNESILFPSCVIASLGKSQFNFVFVNFSCPNVKGEVIHGIMHALGVVHEHNRVDRADHLVVQWSKLAPEFFGHFVFDKPQFVSTFGTPFDFASIMISSFSVGVAKSNDEAFVAKNVSEVVGPIGQRSHLSCADADILRRMYCCSSTCSDASGLCGYWSTKGACVAKQNWSWMRANCARSCRHCCKLKDSDSCDKSKNDTSSCVDYCEQTRKATCFVSFFGVGLC